MANSWHFLWANQNRRSNQRSQTSRTSTSQEIEEYRERMEEMKPIPNFFELIKYSEGQIQHLNPFEGKEITDDMQLEICYFDNDKEVRRTNVKCDEMILALPYFNLEFNVKYPIHLLENAYEKGL